MEFEEAFQAADSAVREIRTEGLRDIERVVLEGSWNRQTYQKIASEAGYTEGYLSRDVGPALWTLLSSALGMQVKKTNFRTAIERWSRAHNDQLGNVMVATQLPRQGRPTFTAEAVSLFNGQLDSLSLDISDFRGRQSRLDDLTRWVIHDRGRLLCLAGVPGVGKTWLAIKLAEHIRADFQQVIYRDLSDRPQTLDLVNDLLIQLAIPLPDEGSLANRLDQLLYMLTQRRCLIVLDGTDHFYRHQALAGTYAPGYEEYSYVLDSFSSREHQSCILWIGQELPRVVISLAGSSCRGLTLMGLEVEALPSLSVWPSSMQATAADWQHLRECYGGIPELILSEVAPRLPSFGHQLDICLQTLQWDSDGVARYVERWLAPLTDREWQLLTLLVICRRPLSLTQLKTYSAATVSLSVIESLCDRGICRVLVQDEPHWEVTLPALLEPFVCDRFLALFQATSEEAIVDHLNQYPLLQADAPEMIRQWQRQTLLIPVADCLAIAFPQLSDKHLFLHRAIHLSQQQAHANPTFGYSAGNLINLAQYWQMSLVNLDLRGLPLREADLQSDLCQGISFAGADLSHTLLAKPLGPTPVMAIHPDQSQVAVGDQDGRLLLWNMHDGRLQRAMLNVTAPVGAIAYSPDGNVLAEGRHDGTVRLWDLRSEYGPELFAADLPGGLTQLTFNAKQQYLIGGDDQGFVYIWRLASGEEVHRLAAHTAGIVQIACSPNGERLITCGQDCAAIEWDGLSGQPRHRFQGRLTNLLGTVAYLPESINGGMRAVVVGRDDGQLVIWDLSSARPLRIMKETCDLFMALALSPDGRFLAVSDVTNHVSVWDVQTRLRMYQLSEPSAPVESLAFSPDSQTLMTGCDYAVQQWQVRSGQCLRMWRSDRHPANMLALATDPLQLLSSHDDYTLRCWQYIPERRRWLPQERLPIPSASLMSAIAISPTGTYWAVGTESGHIHVWDATQQIWLVWSMRLPGMVTALAFHPEGQQLAAGDATGAVALWNLPDSLLRWQNPQAHSDRVTALTFTPDGRRLYSGSRDRAIQGWDDHGHHLGTLNGHRRRIHTLCGAANSQTLYSGSYDGTVCRWQLSDHTVISTWERRDQYIHTITLDPQHRPTVLVSDTQTLELWDLDTDARRLTFPSQTATIWHVSTSLDGTTLVCAAQSGDISLWSLSSGEPCGQLRVDRPYEGMQISDCKGLTDSERQMLYSLGATDY